MNFDAFNPIEELLDELEFEDERRREMLRLPFECHFESGRNNGLEINLRHSGMRINFNGPASSHPSDPTLRDIPQHDNDYQQGSKNGSVGANYHKLNLQTANNPELRYKDGIPAECYQVSKPTRIYRSPPRLYSERDLPNLYFDSSHKTNGSSKNKDLDKLCRKLRQISQNCQDAKFRARQFESAVESDENAFAGFKATRQGSVQLFSHSNPVLKPNFAQNPLINKTYTVNSLSSQQRLLAESLPCMITEKRQKIEIYLQRLEVAAQRLPLIGKQLEHVLVMREDKNIAFEFAELIERRMRICDDQLKRLLRDRCNIPKTKRQIANFEIGAKKRDIELLDELLATMRSQLKIQPSDDYIGRRAAAHKNAPGRLKQLQILENSIGQVLL